VQHAAVAYSLWFILRPFGRTIATAAAITIRYLKFMSFLISILEIS
jgi:hypothetical protein